MCVVHIKKVMLLVFNSKNTLLHKEIKKIPEHHKFLRNIPTFHKTFIPQTINPRKHSKITIYKLLNQNLYNFLHSFQHNL